MKLYFSPFTCSLSPHIALRETGLSFELVRVNNKTKRTERGDDFLEINPKGYVPALEISEGVVLTEGPAIVQYVADLKPETKLAPPWGTLERYRLIEWLNYIATELHKQFSPLFKGATSDEERTRVRVLLAKRIGFLESALGHAPYLTGACFTVADGYAFSVLNWARSTQVDLAPFPNVRAFQARVAERPAVKAAVEYELSQRDAT
jgi:glutathione S-transferase